MIYKLAYRFRVHGVILDEDIVYAEAPDEHEAKKVFEELLRQGATDFAELAESYLPLIPYSYTIFLIRPEVEWWSDTVLVGSIPYLEQIT